MTQLNRSWRTNGLHSDHNFIINGICSFVQTDETRINLKTNWRAHKRRRAMKAKKQYSRKEKVMKKKRRKRDEQINIVI